jgi:hypothetical protein
MIIDRTGQPVRRFWEVFSKDDILCLGFKRPMNDWMTRKTRDNSKYDVYPLHATCCSSCI